MHDPAGTDYLAVRLLTSENVYNETSGQEFDGHYFDDVSLTFITIPGDTNGDDVVDATDAAALADHWLSDVGAGACLGYYAAKFVGDRWLPPRRDDDGDEAMITLRPTGSGLALVRSF